MLSPVTKVAGDACQSVYYCRFQIEFSLVEFFGKNVTE